MRLPRHSRVYPADQTAAMMRYIPAFANGTVGARSAPIVLGAGVEARLAAIEARLAGGIPVTEQHPENFAGPMRGIASGAVNAHAALDGRLAAVDGAGN